MAQGNDDHQPADTIEIVDENLREGFAQVPRPVLRAKGLSIKAKLVYIALLDYAWQKGSCFPGQGTLAEDLDSSVDTIYRALIELKQFGLLNWQRQGLNKANVYHLLRLSDCPHLDASRRNPQVAESGTRKLRIQESAMLRNKEYSNNNTHTISKYSKARPSVSELSYLEPASSDTKQVLVTRHSNPTAVGTLLARTTSIRSRSADHQISPRIAELITTWSGEWRDSIHLRSNLTQTRNILEKCGWSEEAFVQVLYQAHSTTMQDGRKARKKMAYCFAVLRDLVGVAAVGNESYDKSRLSGRQPIPGLFCSLQQWILSKSAIRLSTYM